MDSTKSEAVKKAGARWLQCPYFSAAAAAFFAPPLCFNTAFTIFCSSIKNARTILSTRHNTQTGMPLSATERSDGMRLVRLIGTLSSLVVGR